MDRTYQLRIGKPQRPVARYEASLYRVTSDGGLKLVAQISEDDDIAGLGEVMARLGEQLIDYQDEHAGQLP